MSSSLERWKFFRRQGLTADAALGLTRAEERAEREGIECHWEDDPEPWRYGEMSDPPIAEKDWPRHILIAWVETPAGSYEGLGFIGLNSTHDPHMRVVAAELYARVFASDDRRAAALAQRAAITAAFESAVASYL